MLMEQRAAFKSMRESTKADWDIIVARYQPFAKNSIYKNTCEI